MLKKKSVLYFVCTLAACVLFAGCGGREKGEVVVIGGAGNSGSPSTWSESDGEGTQGRAPGEEAGDGISTSEPLRIQVYVCGAVANPGVVSLPPGSRIGDALEAAGGFAESAGRESVNLADWVFDGQMVYFPTAGEALEIRALESEKALGLVNINTADAAVLCTLPGIGESRAADIIAYREKNGGFETCEDIMKVSGIKTSVYEKICDKITVK